MRKSRVSFSLPIKDPICVGMMHDYDDSPFKRKPWMEKLRVINFEELSRIEESE